MSRSNAEKVPALKLTLGGAPEEWHVVPGVGYVHPTIPSPVGGPGEPSVERANDVHGDAGCPVELVQVSEHEASEARKQLAEARKAGVGGARETRAAGEDASPADVEKVVTEVEAAMPPAERPEAASAARKE